MIGDQLGIAKKLSFGVGHVLNDLTASMWFSYLLIYLHRVVLFENAIAGYVMLLGQVADAISTAFVGFESDRTESGLCNYGKRKSWHLIGVISVVVSFPFVFNLCIMCENTSEWLRFYYYAPFIVIFQFGWASTQISHLSLIPELTTSENERVALNAIRYAFTVASNLFVYGITFLFLRFNPSDTSSSPDDGDSNINRADSSKFMYISLIVIGVGLIFQIIFHVGTKEKNTDTHEVSSSYESTSYANQAQLDWLGYLKNYRFYVMALLYLSTRLIVNMTQVYLPMFVTDTLSLDKTSIAIIPLICYTSGFISTFPLRYLSKKLGSYVKWLFVKILKIKYFIGILFIIACSILFWYYDIIYTKYATVVVASILLGSGSTIILVTSLALTSDLIGRNTSTGAFVFGAMSFTDKLSNGIAVAVLQQLSPCQFHSVTCDCRYYYHKIMAFVPMGCCVLALLALFLLYFNRSSQETSQNSSLLSSTSSIEDQEQAVQQAYGSINQ